MSEGPAAVSSRASRERVPPALRRSRSNLRHADPTADAHHLMRSSSGVCVGSVVELGVMAWSAWRGSSTPTCHQTVAAQWSHRFGSVTLGESVRLHVAMSQERALSVRRNARESLPRWLCERLYSWHVVTVLLRVVYANVRGLFGLVCYKYGLDAKSSENEHRTVLQSRAHLTPFRPQLFSQGGPV